MTRPTRVKVGPLWYSVHWRDLAWSRAAECAGQCDNSLQTISIYEDQRPEKIACAFAHEVAHALLFVGNHGTSTITEEEAADTASYGMVQFWQDNPEAFRWWIELVTTAGADVKARA